MLVHCGGNNHDHDDIKDDNFLLCMGGGQHSEQHRGEGEQSADNRESFNSSSFYDLLYLTFKIG